MHIFFTKENLFRFNEELNNYDIRFNGEKVPIDRRENGTPLDGLHYLYYLIKAKATAPNETNTLLEGDGLDIIELWNAVNMSSGTHVNEGDGLHIIEDHLGLPEDSIEIHQDALEVGQRIILIDDVLATGGTLAACIDLVKTNFKIDLVEVALLIELDFLNGRQKLGDIPIYSVMNF